MNIWNTISDVIYQGSRIPASDIIVYFVTDYIAYSIKKDAEYIHLTKSGLHV